MLFKKCWIKNGVFSARAPPSKLVFIGAKGAFRKVLRLVSRKWISQNSSKGGPFESPGGRIPEGRAYAPRPPPPIPLIPLLTLWIIRLTYGGDGCDAKVECTCESPVGVDLVTGRVSLELMHLQLQQNLIHLQHTTFFWPKPSKSDQKLHFLAWFLKSLPAASTFLQRRPFIVFSKSSNLFKLKKLNTLSNFFSQESWVFCNFNPKKCGVERIWTFFGEDVNLIPIIIIVSIKCSFIIG